MNTHNLHIDFGRHKGELWTRVPVSYLKWILNQAGMNEHNKAIAQAELERRGTTTPELDISGHAIDRASLHLRRTWHETALDANEGLHSWLVRMATLALEQGAEHNGKIMFRGIEFAFETDGCWPVLKTVMPAKRKSA